MTNSGPHQPVKLHDSRHYAKLRTRQLQHRGVKMLSLVTPKKTPKLLLSPDENEEHAEDTQKQLDSASDPGIRTTEGDEDEGPQTARSATMRISDEGRARGSSHSTRRTVPHTANGRSKQSRASDSVRPKRERQRLPGEFDPTRKLSTAYSVADLQNLLSGVRRRSDD
jgi:hypothetical protein